MKIVADEAVIDFIHEHGGRLWVWIDPHYQVDGCRTSLVASTSPPGTTPRTRMRSSRRATWFMTTRGRGIEVLLYPGSLEPPEELHLQLEGSSRDRIEASWDGRLYVGDLSPLAGT